MSRSWRWFGVAAAVGALLAGRAGAGSYISATGTFTTSSGAWEDFYVTVYEPANNMILKTLAWGGGTNAAGEMVPPEGIDSILTWYLGETQVAQNDNAEVVPATRDSLLSYRGAGTSYLAPQPASGYRLRLTNYGSDIRDGHWATDIVNSNGPLTIYSAASSSSNLNTLALGGSGGATSVLQLNVGTLALGGQLTAKSAGIINVAGGTLTANGDILLDGGSLTQTTGALNWAAGKTMTVKNGGSYWRPIGFSSAYAIPDGATVNVTGSGSSITFQADRDSWFYVGRTGGAPCSMKVSGGAALHLNGAALVVSSGTLTLQDSDLTDANYVYVQPGGQLKFAATNTNPAYVINRSLYVEGRVTVMADPCAVNLEVRGGTWVGNGGILETRNPGAGFKAMGDVWVESGGRVDLSTEYLFRLGDGKALSIKGGGRADLDAFFAVAGSVVVDGTTSSYNSGSTTIALSVGGGGAASMAVRNGAQAALGGYSSCETTGGPPPGNGPSTGSLTIETGGQVTADSIWLAPNEGEVARVASITITGGTSSLTQNADKWLTLGSNEAGGLSTATFTVNGGTFIQTGNATTVLHKTGTFNLNGGVATLGALLLNGGTMNFSAGRLSFVGDLVVGTGGLLGPSFDLTPARDLTLSGTTTIDPGSVLTLDGGSFSTGSLVPNGRLQFLSGTLALTGPGGLSVGAGGPLGKNVAVGPGCNLSIAQTTTIAADSELSLGGGMLTTGALANAGLLAVDGTSSAALGAASTNSGEILLSGGASSLTGTGTLANSGLIRGDGRVACPVSNAAAGEIRAEAGKRLLFQAPQGTNCGLISLQGGTADFTMPLTNGNTGVILGRGTLNIGGAGLTNQGRIGFSGGYADVFGDVTNSAGAKIIVSGGATATFYDDVNAAGGEMRVGAGCAAVFFGSYNGGATGTGTVYIEGDLRPGHSPATTTFEGDLALGSGATLVAELAGLAPGSQYDKIDVAGSLALGGTLEVKLLYGFAPHLGQTFDLLDFYPASLSGRFDAIALPELGGGVAWDTSNLCSTGAISVVPEPATLALLAVGSLLLRRRRGRRFTQEGA